MTRRTVLFSTIATFILMGMGLLFRQLIDVSGESCQKSIEKLRCGTFDTVSQVLVLLGAVVLFLVVILPIVTTLTYPALRDERRRRYPQMPDEALFEILLIKDWKKND